MCSSRVVATGDRRELEEFVLECQGSPWDPGGRWIAGSESSRRRLGGVEGPVGLAVDTGQPQWRKRVGPRTKMCLPVGDSGRTTSGVSGAEWGQGFIVVAKSG